MRTKKNKKNFRKLYKDNLRSQQTKWEAERKKKENNRRRLQSTCNPNKIRTYACQLGSKTQTIKYFNYEFDNNEGQCVEKVKTSLV